MKNKEIAIHVGTTEQVVKNYLRKVYDKLGVADRLELALYCLNHRVIEGSIKPASSPESCPCQWRYFNFGSPTHDALASVCPKRYSSSRPQSHFLAVDTRTNYLHDV